MSSLRTWLSQLASLRPFRRVTPKKAEVKPRPRFRPTLEVLEDRLAPATITVNSVSDTDVFDGQVTLREAIKSINSGANANADVVPSGSAYGIADTINFVIGSGLATINVGASAGPTFGTALPAIVKPVTIDGTTQNGYNPSHVPIIELNGAGITGGSTGLQLATNSQGSTIKGLVINRFNGIGIYVNSSNNNVQNCYIGTNAAGSAAAANFLAGIVISGNATGNRIGGNTTVLGNVISGNTHHGIVLDTGTSGTFIEGNYIGLNAAGTAAIANGDYGVFAYGSANNLIGTPGAGNVISGNGRAGVLLYLSGSSSNTVQGNYIGVNAIGNAAVPNKYGVWALNSKNNTIGGLSKPAGNIISGNSLEGIVLEGSGSTVNKIQGNFIGADPTGAVAIPNVLDGVLIKSMAAGNDIGGAVAGAGNVISGNTSGIGVRITDPGTIGNLVRGNLIGLNAGANATLPNFVGVWITGGATGNNIGATVAFPNTISGNNVFGVVLSGLGTNNNQVSANRIGTDPGANIAFPNLFDGVVIAQGASTNIIGGPAVGAGNVISGNGGNGVLILGAAGFSTTGNSLKHNYIGLTGDGLNPLGNGKNGVLIAGGAFANFVGGAYESAGNLISSNVRNGVMITDPGTNSNIVAGNSIGLDVNLNVARGNTIGVLIAMGAKNNTIGGISAVTGGGNFIGSNKSAGVRIADAGTNGNVVQGNLIGLRGNGTQTRSNTLGVEIANGPTGNLIGGTGNTQRNVISGNSRIGLYIHGAVGNTVQGNYIGTGVAGTQPNLGNGIGVQIFGVPGITSTLDTTIIGGATPQARNIISGNVLTGVEISQTGATTGPPTAIVMGNYIGADVTGNVALPNGGDGVDIIIGTRNVLVGGTVAGAGNLISGNGRCGVFFSSNALSGPSSGNLVQGNLIGTKANGIDPLGNSSHGVFLTGVNVTGNTIGGMLETQPLAGNIIAFNIGRGVLIGSAPGFPTATDPAGIGNAVLGNRIYKNAPTGIDLGDNDGVTPNDLNPDDVDTGPNNLQNFPVLTGAFVAGSVLIVVGALNSDGPDGAVYRIEFFVGTLPGDAEYYCGFLNVTIASNVASISGVVSFPLGFLGRQIIATATRIDTMDTSEFSAGFAATP